MLKAVALIVIDHQEKWIGSGYPNGKPDEDIAGLLEDQKGGQF